MSDAVEAEIPKLSALVQVWPPTFASADVAAKYIAGVAALQEFEYTRFEGVSEEKFRAYVTWNTARRAWETDSFEMDRVPKGWKRRASKTFKTAETEHSAATMTSTCPLSQGVRHSAVEFIGLTRNRCDRIRHCPPFHAHTTRSLARIVRRP